MIGSVDQWLSHGVNRSLADPSDRSVMNAKSSRRNQW